MPIPPLQTLKPWLLGGVLITSLFNFGSLQADQSTFDQRSYVPGEVLVKFKANRSGGFQNILNSQSGAYLKRSFKSSALEHWQLAVDATVEETISQLYASGAVEYAEPNYLRERRVMPNDPLLPNSWAIRNQGQQVPSVNVNGERIQVIGIPGQDMQLDQAWDITTGSKSVIVAILDDGVDLDHPDLKANIWTNPGEIAGDGIDNDGNGYIDDVHGWDAVDNDNDPNPDVSGFHGTNVAGAVGAVGNNGVGVSGSAWNVSLLPVRFGFDVASEIAGMDYAITAGADIINASFGGVEYSQAEAEAIARLEAAGILMVAAAGNDQVNNDYIPDYPANYPGNHIVSVTGSTARGAPVPWAHIGQTSVDVAAPGAGVFLPMFSDTQYSPFPGTDAAGNTLESGSLYGYTSGTSFSAPYVAGIAALLKTRYPNADHRTLKARLMSGTHDFSDSWNYLNATNGKISAVKALQAVPAPLLVVNKVTTQDVQGAKLSRYVSGQTYQLSLSLENLWQAATNVSAVLKTADSFVQLETSSVGYGNIARNSIIMNNMFSFSLSEDLGDRPIRFEVSLQADNGYSVNRRFVLENVQTLANAHFLFNSGGELTAALEPDNISYLTEPRELTLPEGYRFIRGFDATYTQQIARGSRRLLGWKLSYLPEDSKIFNCSADTCDLALPTNSQPPQLINEIYYSVEDGGQYDQDGVENGQISSKLVLAEPCAQGQCSAPDSSGDSDSGGGGAMGWQFLAMLMLLMLARGRGFLFAERARHNSRHSH